MGEKGQYGYVRMSEDPVKKPKRTKRNRSPVAGEQEQLVAGPSGEVGDPQPVHMPMLNAEGLIYSQPIAVPYLPPPGSGPMDPVPAPMLRDGNDADESGWAIRVGDSPPPDWARRESDVDDQGSRKRTRLEYVSSEGFYFLMTC
jgi:hypothetical protein